MRLSTVLSDINGESTLIESFIDQDKYIDSSEESMTELLKVSCGDFKEIYKAKRIPILFS